VQDVNKLVKQFREAQEIDEDVAENGRKRLGKFVWLVD